MQTFTDATNRKWVLHLTTWEAMRIKANTSIDLLEWGAEDLFTKLGKDPLVCADIGFTLVEEQAKLLGIDKKEFCKSLDGDKFDELSTLVLEEIINFFPCRKKVLLQKIVKTTLKKQDEAISSLNTLLDDGNTSGKLLEDVA